MNPGEHITSFTQARLINKNCLFVCVKSRDSEQQERHELRGFEIARDGQTCDFWLRVDLFNEERRTATDLYMGSDALYINLSNQALSKLDVLKELHDNDFDSLEVTDRLLSEFPKFELHHGQHSDVVSAIELENESDSWRQHGQPPDLLCCVYKDGCVEVFDRTTTDLLKTEDGMQARFAGSYKEVIQVEVMGD